MSAAQKNQLLRSLRVTKRLRVALNTTKQWRSACDARELFRLKPPRSRRKVVMCLVRLCGRRGIIFDQDKVYNGLHVSIAVSAKPAISSRALAKSKFRVLTIKTNYKLYIVVRNITPINTVGNISGFAFYFSESTK